MLNSNQEEQLVQLLIDRINALNEDILEIIGNRIKEIGEMTPTQVHQINQMLIISYQNVTLNPSFIFHIPPTIYLLYQNVVLYHN